MPKPLPKPVFKPNPTNFLQKQNTSGILLGENISYNPETLANAHITLIGGSGSGKTQTLKSIAWEITQKYPTSKVVMVDFHGDQELPNEVYYPLNMESPYGINPLAVDCDLKGGGPGLQSVAVAASLKKALALGPNQEGALIEILNSCYENLGIVQNHPQSWQKSPPNFADLKEEIINRIESDADKNAEKLLLKLTAIFQYKIFNKPQPSIDYPLVRFDLSALAKVQGLQAIVAETIAKQLLDNHRLLGEIEGKVPRTFLFIDEAKEVKLSRSLKLIYADGRKYGLAAIVASQRDQEISSEAIANSTTKIVLSVDASEVARVSRRFRFAEAIVAQLKPLEALVRLGTEVHKCKIKPFYERAC